MNHILTFKLFGRLYTVLDVIQYHPSGRVTVRAARGARLEVVIVTVSRNDIEVKYGR